MGNICTSSKGENADVTNETEKLTIKSRMTSAVGSIRVKISSLPKVLKKQKKSVENLEETKEEAKVEQAENEISQVKTNINEIEEEVELKNEVSTVVQIHVSSEENLCNDNEITDSNTVKVISVIIESSSESGNVVEDSATSTEDNSNICGECVENDVEKCDLNRSTESQCKSEITEVIDADIIKNEESGNIDLELQEELIECKIIKRKNSKGSNSSSINIDGEEKLTTLKEFNFSALNDDETINESTTLISKIEIRLSAEAQQ